MPEKTTEQPRSLIKKLAEVMSEVERVEKRGENSFHGYKYAMEADLVDEIRPKLAKRNIMVLPTLMETVRFQHTNGKGNVTFLTDVKVKWTIEDGDSGETKELIFPGCGEDSGDKGIYKALTGSEKYMLMKTFLIATGDDPEKDDRSPAASGDGIKGPKVRDYKLKKPAVSNAAPGGKAKGEALGNTGDVLTVVGPLGRVWVSEAFTNFVVNQVRFWTKDSELSQLILDLDGQSREDNQPAYVEAIGRVGRTPTALELTELNIKEIPVDDNEPTEISF